MAERIESGKPCPKCGKKLTKYAWHSNCYHCGATGEEFVSTPPSRSFTLKPGQREYKVVTQADQWFMGKFSPERLGTMMNELASEGWSVVAVTSADRGTWFGSFGGGARQEIVVFLERPVTAEITMKTHSETVTDVL